jgi:hypothetical protein
LEYSLGGVINRREERRKSKVWGGFIDGMT